MAHSTPTLDFTRPIVFLLGAGASHPYSFPLGRDLKGSLLANSGGLSRFLPEGRFDQQIINDFREALQRTIHGTIDTFLEHKKSFREYASFAIAHAINSSELGSSLFPRRDWYAVLYDMLKLEDPDRAVAQIDFVTLNYDRSLEHFLAGTLKYDCHDNHIEQARKVLSEVRVIHAHGSLGDYPAVPFGVEFSKEQLAAAAKSLRIISDSLDQMPDFAKAKECLGAAEQIVILGFGFDPRTAERLFSDVDLKETRVFCCTYGLSPDRMEQVTHQFDHRHVISSETDPADTFLRAIATAKPRDYGVAFGA